MGLSKKLYICNCTVPNAVQFLNSEPVADLTY